jgi:hypothetical protein
MIVKCGQTMCKYNADSKCTRDEIEIKAFEVYDDNPYDLVTTYKCGSLEYQIGKK